MIQHILNLLKPSPFKSGLLAILLSLCLHPMFPLGLTTQTVTEFINGLDDRFHDYMFIVRGKEVDHTLAAVVVDIDETSLKDLGQWPWPRTTVAQMVRNLSACSPKAIGFDVVFSEPDRTSLKHKLPDLMTLTGRQTTIPKEVDEEGWTRESDEVIAEYEAAFRQVLKLDTGTFPAIPLDNDRVLAKAIAECPQVVLGYFWLNYSDGLLDPKNPPAPIGSNFIRRTLPGHEFISPFKTNDVIPYRPVLNQDLLEEAADDRAGSFNAAFLAAGTVRRVPLIWEYIDENIYPALSLQMLRVGLGAEQGFVWFDNLGVDRIEMPSIPFSVTTDKIAQVYVNFRGPQRTFPYLSASEVVSGKFDTAFLKDKYILIGSSAGGLMDLRSIAFEKAYPGVEVHANVIDNLLQGDYLTTPRDSFTYEFIMMIGLGIFASGLLAWTKPLVGMPLSALLVMGIFVSNYILMFTYHIVLNVTYPLSTLVAALIVVPTFNYLIEGKQKRFIKNAFGTYLSPALVEEVTNSPDLLSLKGQQKELTILFSDIRNFTSISEGLSAEQLSSFLNEYLTPMTDIVMTTRGTVDKFIGDAVMAFWGAPVDIPQHAQQAARCALKMMDALHALRPHWKERGLPFVDIGIGINTGTVSVGNMGSTSRFDYTVMGDSVNLASRLEGQNKNYGTNIMTSEFTRKILGEDFFCRRLDCIRVKGKKEAVWVYEIICEGEPAPEIRAEVEAFEAMLTLYHDQHFIEAEQALKSMNQERNPHLIQLYLDRIAGYNAAPPPKDWDGAYTLTTK